MVAHTRCPSCSAALRPDAQWCGLCFRDLRVVPAPAVPVQPAPAVPVQAVPAGPVPAHLVQAQPVAGRPDLPLQPVARQADQADQAAHADPGEATAAEAPGASAPARRAGWPCAICSLLVPIEAEACPSCGASFLSTLQADTARQAPRAGFIMRLPRSARLAGAVVLSFVVAVLLPLLLTLFG